MARSAYVSLCLIGLAVSAFTIGPNWNYAARGQTDFMDLYAGGKLAFSHDLYEPGRVMKVESETEGFYSPTRLFMRPPAFAVLLSPLGQLPYRTATWAWEGLSLGAWAAFVMFWPVRNRWGSAVACCGSVPVLMSIAEGQDIGFVLLWIAVAARLFRGRRDFVAGLALSLCAAKFHLFLLVPVWLIASRRWRIAGGVATGGLALVILSFANGLDWPVRYVQLLVNPTNNPYASVMPGIHGLVAGLPGHVWIEGLGLTVVGVLVWMASRRTGVENGFAAALAGGILVTPHAYLADCALLIPGALMVIENLSLAVAAQKAVGTARNAIALMLLAPFVYWRFLAGVTLPVALLLACFVLCVAACNETRPPVMGEVIVGPLKQDQHPVFELHDIEQVYE